MSVARTVAAFYFLTMLIAVCISAVSRQLRPEEGWRPLVVAVVAPIGWAVAAFAFTAVLCWAYNWLAGRFGGIAIEIRQHTRP